VFAGFQGRDGEWHVQGSGHAKIHQVHFRIGQQVIELFVNLEFAAQIQGIGAGDVAADSGQDAVDRLAH